MSDLISKSALLNYIGTHCHYDTEHPLEAYSSILSAVVNMPTLSSDDIKNMLRVKEKSTETFKAVLDELRYDR